MTKLDVVTGFLGAGKTTFLTRYTRWLGKRGVRYCVIENEFGRAGVDGALLESVGAHVKEISGGCVCCTLKVGLHDLMCDLSDEVERILLEPSGLFCGDDLMDILHSPDCTVEPGMWLGLLDPLAVGAMNGEDTAVLQSELMYAGSVAVSKAQHAERDELKATIRLLRKLVPDPAPVLWTQDWDAYQEDVWFAALQAAGTVERPHERRRFDHAAMFQSASFAPKASYDERALRACLSRLMDGGAGAVLRVKGTLAAKGGGYWRVNGTPGCEWISRESGDSAPMLNIIGRGLAREALRARLEENT